MEPTTDIQAWRASRTTEHILQLGCGLRVKVRQVALLDLAAAGHIPLPLAGQVAELIDKGVSDLDPESLQKNLPLVKAVVKAIALEPKITDTTSDDSIGVDEIPVYDLLWMYSWAQREVAPIKSFPVGEQTNGASPKRRGRNVPSASE